MTTPLQTQLLDTIDAELADARLARQHAEDRIDEAQALREVFVELLTPPLELVEDLTAAIPVGPDFRRSVLAALEEQTPHSAREIAARLQLDPDDIAVVKKIRNHLRVLRDAERVRLVGERHNEDVEFHGRAAKFYVKLALNGDGKPREREIIWP